MFFVLILTKSLKNCEINAFENEIINKFQFHNRKFITSDLSNIPEIH